MDVFPAFWQLDGKRVLVVGGADAAARKLRLIARTKASITVFAENPISEVREFAADGRIVLESRPLGTSDIDGSVAFAIVATDDDGIAKDAVSILNAARVPVNAVDRTDLCDFLIPSIVDRNPVVVGIASGGAAPVLVKNIRVAIESLLPARVGKLARFAGRFRAAVRSTVPDGKARKAFWEGFFDGPIARKVLAGDEVGAREDMITAINRDGPSARPRGTVQVIELDPTEGDLISLRSIRALQAADLILHRDSFDETVRELFRRDADRERFQRFDSALGQARIAANAGIRAVVLAETGEVPMTLDHAVDVDVLRHGSPARRAAAAVGA